MVICVSNAKIIEINWINKVAISYFHVTNSLGIVRGFYFQVVNELIVG